MALGTVSENTTRVPDFHILKVHLDDFDILDLGFFDIFGETGALRFVLGRQAHVCRIFNSSYSVHTSPKRMA